MKEKHVFRSGLSLILALCMIIGVLPVAAFAEPDPEPKKTIHLVSFGDSMTNGYGHPGYYEGGTQEKQFSDGTQVNGFRQNDLTTTYPSMLKAYFEEELGYDVDWEALAVSCMRTEDVNFLLRYDTENWNENPSSWGGADVDSWNGSVKKKWEDTFVDDDGNVIGGDYFTWNEFVKSRFNDWGKVEGGDWVENPTLAYAKYYQDAVKNADVITLGTGNANFGVIMLQNITSCLTEQKNGDDKWETAFGSGFKDAVPVREVLKSRLPADVLPKALEILDKVDALVIPQLGVLKGNVRDTEVSKAAKVLEIVEYTVVSFMFSYMDMLYAIDELNNYAIDELNNKDNLDIIMMGLMNTMDGVKIDLGDGQIFDLGAVVDGITDVLSAYYFILPVALQELNGDFKNITFYIVPNDDYIEMQVSDMASLDNIKKSNTIRERMIQEVSGMIFGLVRGTKTTGIQGEEGYKPGTGLNGALESFQLELPNWSMDDNNAYQYRKKVEAYEALQKAYQSWVDGGYSGAFVPPMNGVTDDLLDHPSDMLACAVYLAVEEAIIANADKATLKLDGLKSLMGGTAGLGKMFTPIAGAITLDQSALTEKVQTAVLLGGDQATVQAIELTKALNGALGKALTGKDTLTGKDSEDPEVREAAASLGGLLSLFARMIIGNGIGSHPTANGHNKLFLEIMEVYPGVRAQDWIVAKVREGLVLVYNYGADTLIKVVDYVIDDPEIAAMARSQITEADKALKAGDTGAVIASFEKLAVIITDYIVENPDQSFDFFDVAKLYVEDYGTQLYGILYQYGADSLLTVVDYAEKFGFIKADVAAMARSQITKADKALKAGDNKSVFESCKFLAGILYTNALNNGVIPAEFDLALKNAIAYYQQNIEGKTVEELKEFAADKILAFVEQYSPAALACLNDYILGLNLLNEQQLKELEDKIWAFAVSYPDAPKATAKAAAYELVDFLFTATDLDSAKADEIVAKIWVVYRYLNTVTVDQLYNDTMAVLSPLFDRFDPEAFDRLKDYVTSQNWLTDAQVFALKAQISLVADAVDGGNEDEIKAACFDLAQMIRSFASANVTVPVEVKAAIAQVLAAYGFFADLTPDEIKTLAVRELQTLINAYGPEALIAFKSYAIQKGYITEAGLADLSNQIASVIMAYNADPEGFVNGTLVNFVNFLCTEAVKAGYINPADVAQLIQLSGIINEFRQYFENTSEEQAKAEILALINGYLGRFAAQYVDPAILAQYQAELVNLIGLIQNFTPETVEGKVQQIVDFVIAIYDQMLHDATHKRFFQSSESYYVALGGGSASGNGVAGPYSYFDLLVKELELADGQYNNLSRQGLLFSETLKYIAENRDEIAKADLITYDMDAVAFLLGVVNDVDVDWTRYFTEEELAFVDQAIPAIRKVLEDDWTRFVDFDAEQIVNCAKTQILNQIETSVIEELKRQEGKLDELLPICVAQVKSAISYAQSVSTDALATTLAVETELYARAMKPVYEALSLNWPTYAQLDEDQIVASVRNEVMAKLDGFKGYTEKQVNDALSLCVKEARKLHEEALEQVNAVTNELLNEGVLTEDRIHLAKNLAEITRIVLVKNWPEIKDFAADKIHERIKNEVVSELEKADNFNYAQYVDLSAADLDSILRQTEAVVMDEIRKIELEAKDVVRMIDGKQADFVNVMKFALDFVNKDWNSLVESNVTELTAQFKSAVKTEVKKQFAMGEDLADAIAADVTDVLLFTIDTVNKVQDAKNGIVAAWDAAEPFMPYAEKLLYASIAYAVDTVKVIDAIREINPTADLAVIGMYNPMRNLTVQVAGTTVDVGGYVDYLIDATDVYYTALALVKRNFIFVDVSDAETKGFDTTVDLDKTFGIANIVKTALYENEVDPNELINAASIVVNAVLAVDFSAIELPAIGKIAEELVTSFRTNDVQIDVTALFGACKSIVEQFRANNIDPAVVVSAIGTVLKIDALVGSGVDPDSLVLPINIISGALLDYNISTTQLIKAVDCVKGVLTANTFDPTSLVNAVNQVTKTVIDSNIELDVPGWINAGKMLLNSLNAYYDGDVKALSEDAFTAAKFLLGIESGMYADANGHKYIYDRLIDAFFEFPMITNFTRKVEMKYEAEVTFEKHNTVAVVKCDKTCVLVALTKSGEYVRLDGVFDEETGTYKFDLSVLTENFSLIVALKGDYDMDGELTKDDVALANRAILDEEFDPLLACVFDANGDGVLTTNDVAIVNKSIVDNVALAW